MGSRGFKRKGEHELAQLPEDKLIAYLASARTAGDVEASGTAVAILIYGLMDNVQRVALKVPREAVEEVSESVLLSVLRSEFAGSSVGEFRKWTGTIIQRRVADYHRDPKRDVRLVALPTEHLGDEEIWGDEPSVEFEGEAVDAERAVEQAYGDLNDKHQLVIDLYVFADLPAREAAEQAGVSEANVHKIAQRFRDHLDKLLKDDSDTQG